MKKRLLALLLLPAFVAVGFSQSNQTPSNARSEAYYHFSRARMLDEQGQPNQAIEEYKKALELDPSNSMIYSEMAESYLRNNRVGDAVETAQRAVKVNPDNIEAHRLLGGIYIQIIGRANAQQPPSADVINNAIREFEEIVRIDVMDRQAFLMLGRLYQIKGDRNKATEIYERFLGIEPGSEEGVTSLAKLQMDAGNYQEAASLLEDFLKQQPDSDVALETLGQAYSDLQQYDKAADAYKRASEVDPENLELKKSHAQAMFLADRIDEAAVLYEELIKAEPDDGIALLRLGQIYRRQMKYDQALQHLQKAAQMFPDSVDVQFNLTLVERDSGQLQPALKRITEILRRSERPNGRYTEGERQNRRVFTMHQGTLYSLLENYPEAVRAFTDLKAATPEKDGRVDALIVDTLRTAKDLDRALQHTDQALAESPDNRQLQVLHADIIAERGQVDEAAGTLRKMLKGNDEDLDIFSAISNIYQRAKRFDRAQSALDDAARRFPNNGQVYFMQGALYEKQKKLDDAEKAFRRALDIEKDDPAVLNYLGYMLADRGIKLEEARVMIEKAVKADPINGAYLDSLGWVYFKLNKLDLAEAYLKRAVIFYNHDASIHDHLGDLYFRMKRYEEARAAWTKSLQLATEKEEIDRVRKKLDDLKISRAANK